MPPKARPLRKGSTVSRPTTKDVSTSSTIVVSPTAKAVSPPKPTTQMPPPPPVPATILGSEMQALEESLKESALNMGKIFRFYADARKERIVSHAPYPQRSLVRALGRSLERYDQICDTIEAQLLHAIAVFERDLKAEQARIDAEASASVATRTRSKLHSVSPTAARIPLPSTSPPPAGSEQASLIDSSIFALPPSQFPPPSGASALATVPRRSSAILSSLHRPSFPLKLDLSPAALAGNTDSNAMGPPMDVNVDLGLTSLPSPVTLAPKTARAIPNDSNIPDIFAIGTSQGIPVNAPEAGDAGSIPGPVGMNTTVTTQEDVIDLTGPEASGGGSTQLGDSADKPIELDLEGPPYDGMDLFGDHPADPANVTSDSSAVPGASAHMDVGMEELFTPRDNQTNGFQLDGAIGQTATAADPGTILASLESGAESAGGGSNELSSLLPSSSGQAGASSTDGLPGQTSGDSFAGLGTGDAGTQFDLSGIDLSSFSGLFDAQEGTAGEGEGVGGEEMDLMSLLAMDGGESVNPAGPSEDAGT